MVSSRGRLPRPSPPWTWRTEPVIFLREGEPLGHLLEPARAQLGW
jgi:hypothetical protein